MQNNLKRGYFKKIYFYVLLISLLLMPSLIVSSVTNTVVAANGDSCSLLTIEDHLEVKKTGEAYVSLNNEQTDGRKYALISAGTPGGIGLGKFSIYDQTSGVSRLTIDADGKVGIGIESPSEKLDVVGAIKGTTLCIGTDCKTSWPSLVETDPKVKDWAKIGNPVTITEDVIVKKLTGTTLCIGTDCKTRWDPVKTGVTLNSGEKIVLKGGDPHKFQNNGAIWYDEEGLKLSSEGVKPDITILNENSREVKIGSPTNKHDLIVSGNLIVSGIIKANDGIKIYSCPVYQIKGCSEPETCVGQLQIKSTCTAVENIGIRGNCNYVLKDCSFVGYLVRLV